MKRKTFIRQLAVSSLAITGITGTLSASEIKRGRKNLNSLNFIQIRDGIPNSQFFLRENKVGNQYLFFIGNSVLNGTGLKDQELAYSKQMVKGIAKQFPDSRLIERRQVYPGGSWLGLYRCSHGQPVYGEQIASGHLAILDFAGDDRNLSIGEVKSSVEGLVRQIIHYRPTHSRILVYTLTPEMLQSYSAGKIPEYIRVCEQIADHYGIPSLNLAQYASKKINSGEISFEEFSTDSVNPTDAGARIYAEAVALFMEELLTAYPIPDKALPYTLPAPLFPETHDQGRVIAYENPEVKRSGKWMMGQTSPINPFRHILVSSEAGATLSLKFKGSEIGIIDIVDNDTADYEFSIDGGAFRKLTAPKDITAPTMRPVSLAKGLRREADHELMLKVASPGIIRMGGFLLNGTVSDPFAGMSKLEQIDAIYAAMKPVNYRPPAGRFTNIPVTMSLLNNGSELRMVLLGDSIMGDTSSSQFDLLMMRNYPKCKVLKIPSLRSGTGCKYYCEENRVQDYVLKHNPDLLVIGGISNGDDAEAVRSVIRQVRAKKPDTEVLLLTPVFGTISPTRMLAFTPEIDTSTDNFRHNMQKVAAEEKCGFFDMSGPWWTYLQESGMAYGWFMRDPVHANERGHQIIGRLLETWFRG